MTCDEAVRHFFAYLDRRALPREPLEALQGHLEICLDCCGRLREFWEAVRGRGR